MTVDSMERIAEAIRRKLVLEIAGAAPQVVPAAAFGERRPKRRHGLHDRREAQRLPLRIGPLDGRPRREANGYSPA